MFRWFDLSRRRGVSLLLGFLLLATLSQATLPRRVCTWAAIGPFTPLNGNGMDDNLLASTYSDANAYPYLGMAIGGTTWTLMDDRTYCRNLDDYNDFYTFYKVRRGADVTNKVCYAGAYVYIPSSGTYQLHFGANEYAKLFIDGNCVYNQTTAGQARREGWSTSYSLSQGWRRVLVKVGNVRGPFGFYFNITQTNGARVANMEICPHDPGPGDPLVIYTEATLPRGYQHAPYVHLEVAYSGSYPEDNPSASPFRLVGRGGTAPYTWAITAGSLPTGLSFDGTEGEWLTSAGDGRLPTASIGTTTFTVQMRDSSTPQRTTSKTFSLTVGLSSSAWLIDGNAPRIGGLRHGTTNQWVDPEDIAYAMQRQQYDWCAPTGVDCGVSNGVLFIAQNLDLANFLGACTDAGTLFSAYIGFHEVWSDYSADGIVNVCGYLHQYAEQYMDVYAVPLFWFDKSQGSFRPSGVTTWELDALYSLIKTKDPDCLIVHNSETTKGQDNGLGDLDIVSYEGPNNANSDNYWNNWPGSPLGNNPRYLPQDSWRYSQSGALDASTWLKVIITMLAETANNQALRLVDFDHTCDVGDARWDLHDSVADWLEVGNRKDAIFPIVPGPLTDASWGYSVENRTTGDLYLHLISNPRGKSGFSGGNLTVYNLPTTYNLTRVCFADVPADNLAFSRSGTTLTIQNIPSQRINSISTILWLQRN